MPEAAESLRAQLHSQGKLTTLRHENRKIRHEIEILKATEQVPHVYKLQIFRMTPKNHTTKSRETIPLNGSVVGPNPIPKESVSFGRIRIPKKSLDSDIDTVVKQTFL
jgi:hypothetical protein